VQAVVVGVCGVGGYSSVMRWMVVGVVVVDDNRIRRLYTRRDRNNEHSTEQHGQRDRQTDRQITKRFP